MQTYPTIVSTFYHFSPLQELAALKQELLALMQEKHVKGTVTLAPEGVNATIAGPAQAVEQVQAFIRALPGFSDLKSRLSHYARAPFGKSKVKIKKELISLGEAAHPSVCVGSYVSARDWNALITRKDVITIDTRNDYEYEIGHFKGAINPATRNFKEMVAFTKLHLNPETHPHVAMYCTGGIRCEKYSSYLLMQGFEKVYHLQSGILAYLETMPESESLWEGDCYVFDERVAVGHGLKPNPDISMCQGCGLPLYEKDRAQADYVEGERCGKCAKHRQTAYYA